MHTFFLCEDERSPRRLVETERIRSELRRRQVPSRVIAWRDRAALPQDAVVILAMARSDAVDRNVARWLRTKAAAAMVGMFPARDLALSALVDAGRDRLIARGVPCAPPASAPEGRSVAGLDAVTSVYLVGDVCTHAVRRVDGVVRRVTLGTAPLLLASHAREAFIGEVSSSADGAVPTLGAPYVRVDLRAGADGELRVAGVDPILHGVAAHLHLPIVARIADAICAARCELLSVGAATPQGWSAQK